MLFRTLQRFPELHPTACGRLIADPDHQDDQASQPDGFSTSALGGSEEEGAGELEKLRRALESERKNSSEQAKARKKAEQLYQAVKDLDPETYRKAQERAAEAERLAAEAQQRETEKLRETEAKYSSKLQETLAEKDRAMRELAMERQRNALEKVFLACDGLTVTEEDGVSAFDMFWNMLGKRFRIDSSDGTLGVVDANGDWELDGESGKRLKPGDFIAKQREHKLFSALFKPRYGSGSGVTSSRDVRTAHGEDMSKLSTQEKFALAYSQPKS